MALNHVHLETIVHRESRKDSWSIALTYGVDDESGEIVAETLETYQNHEQPEESYRKSRGQFRVSEDKVPEVVVAAWLRLTGNHERHLLTQCAYLLSAESEKASFAQDAIRGEEQFTDRSIMAKSQAIV